MGDNRTDAGRFAATHTDDEILAAVRAHEPAATSEVADEVGMTRQGADRRLRRLRDAGRVSSKKIGASLVWFDTDVDESDQERGESASPSPDDHADGSTPEPPSTPDTSTESDTRDGDGWHARLAEEVAGSGDLADRRADAILTMYDHLREEGAAEKDELLALVDPDVVEYADRTSVWSNMIKGKDTLRALPGVEKPASGRNKPWRYNP